MRTIAGLISASQSERMKNCATARCMSTDCAAAQRGARSSRLSRSQNPSRARISNGSTRSPETFSQGRVASSVAVSSRDGIKHLVRVESLPRGQPRRRRTPAASVTRNSATNMKNIIRAIPAAITGDARKSEHCRKGCGDQTNYRVVQHDAARIQRMNIKAEDRSGRSAAAGPGACDASQMPPLGSLPTAGFGTYAKHQRRPVPPEHIARARTIHCRRSWLSPFWP